MHVLQHLGLLLDRARQALHIRLRALHRQRQRAHLIPVAGGTGVGGRAGAHGVWGGSPWQPGL
eukprot:5431949-Prymnesium_polylepis.1